MILLPCTLAHMSYIPIGAIRPFFTRPFFTLADPIAPIFTVITEVWLRVNRAVVTNYLTVIIKAMLIEAVLIVGFLSMK